MPTQKTEMRARVGPMPMSRNLSSSSTDSSEMMMMTTMSESEYGKDNHHQNYRNEDNIINDVVVVNIPETRITATPSSSPLTPPSPLPSFPPSPAQHYHHPIPVPAPPPGELENVTRNKNSRKAKNSRRSALRPETSPVKESPSNSCPKSNPDSETDTTNSELDSRTRKSDTTSTDAAIAQVEGKEVINSSTVKVIDALTAFQTYLLMLFSTVSTLQNSLKLLLPFHHPHTPDTGGGGLKMPPHTSQIPFENNNFKKAISHPDHLDGKESSETVITIPISSASSYLTSIDTTCYSSSNASIISPGSSEDIPKKSKSKPRPSSSCSISGACFRWLCRYVGILLALFASICMSIVTLVVKYMEGYSPVSKVIWRLQGVLLPSLVIVLYVKYVQRRPLIIWKKGQDGGLLRSDCWKLQIFLLLVFRGLIGCSADIFQYYSLKYLPLADSTVISFSTPIFVCIVAHFVLGEKFGLVPILCAVLTLCGVIIISKPPILTGEETMNSTLLLGNVLAIFCMISGTFTTVIMRYLQHVHFAMTMLALGVFGTIEGLLVTLFTSPFEIPHLLNYTDWTLALTIAALFFFGQLAMTLALQHEEAGVVSLIRTCDVLFAFVWQVHFLQQEANMLSYIGAVVVTLGVFITALRKWLSDLPEHNKIRRKLFFILR